MDQHPTPLIETIHPITPQSPPTGLPITPSPKKFNWTILCVVIALMVGIVIGLLMNNIMVLSRLKIPVQTPTPTPTSTPLPSPDPDPMESWKMYANKEYSFKYPTAWTVQNKNIFSTDKLIEMWAFETDDSMYNECMRLIDTKILGNITIKSFSGVSSSEMCDPVNLNLREKWIVKTNSEGYAPGLQYSYKSNDSVAETVFTQILSTFKFTNELEPTKTVSTTTYSDINYPFNIQYPIGWTLRTTYGKSVNNLGNSRIAGIDISNSLTYGSTIVVNIIDPKTTGFNEWIKLYAGKSDVPAQPNTTYKEYPAYRFTYSREGKPDVIETYYQYKDKIIYIALNIASISDLSTADQIVNSLNFTE